MARIPTDLGDSLPTPRPQRRVQGYDSGIEARAMQRGGQALEESALMMQKQAENDAAIDAQDRMNKAKQKAILFYNGDGENPGLYSAEGAGTMDADKKSRAFLDGLRNEITSGVTNSRAKQALKTDFDSLDLSYTEKTANFRQSGVKGYKTDLVNANQALTVQRAGMEYNDQKLVEKSVEEARKTARTSSILAGAKINSDGTPGDAISKKMELDATSEVLSAQLLAMSSSQDVNTMREFVNKFKEYQKAGRLTYDAVNKFDGMVKAAAPIVEAADALGKIRGEQVNYANIPMAKIHEGISMRESSGKMFQADGSVTTSYAGAAGLKGIMPDTALHIAKGDEKLAKKIMTDVEYNKIAGESYYEDMQKKYGDVRMALTAYNAGPGRVDDYINGTNKSGKNPELKKFGDPSKGEVTVDQFIAQMPVQEHREYARLVLKGVGYGGKEGIIPMDMATAQASQMNEPTREEFLKQVKQNNLAFQAQTTADVNETAGLIVDTLVKTSGNWMAVPPDLVARAQSNGVWNAVKDYNPSAPSDKVVLETLYALDAEGLAKVDLHSPEYVGGLSPQDKALWKQKQDSLTSSSAVASLELRKKKVDAAMAVRQFNTVDPGPKGDQNRARLVRVNKLIDAMVDTYTQNNKGNMPGEPELQKIVDSVFIQDKVEIPGTNKHIFDIKVEDISRSDREIIAQRLALRDIAATPARIIEMYVKNQN